MGFNGVYPIATPDGWRPHPSMPSGHAVHYWRELILLALILLALPWLVRHLIQNPGRVLAGRGPAGPA